MGMVEIFAKFPGKYGLPLKEKPEYYSMAGQRRLYKLFSQILVINCLTLN